MGVVGYEKSVTGNSCGANDRIRELHPVVFTQRQSLFYQVSIDVLQFYNFNPFSELFKTFAIVVGKTVKGEKLQIRNN